MLCLTNFARRGRRPGAARPATPASHRAAAHKSADILRCDEFSHEACGRDFTYWIERFGYRLLRGRPRTSPGGPARSAPCGRSSTPGCTRPGTAKTSSAPTARSASACGSARLEGNGGAHVWTQDFGATAERVSDVRTACRAPVRLGSPRARRLLRARRRPLLATELTRGPWDPGAQHAGPPAALLGRALERLPEAEDFQVGRVTFEILRSVPIAPVRVRPGSLRPGRRVQLVEAELSDEDGEVLMRATRLADPHRRGRDPGRGDGRRRPAAARARAGRRGRVLPDRAGARLPHGDGGAASSPAASSSRARRRSGCGCASRWSPARSRRRCSGRWSPPTSATAISAALDYRRYLFINVDLTVHLERHAGGRVGLRRRRDPAAAERGRHRRVGALRRARPDRPRAADAAGQPSASDAVGSPASRRRGRLTARAIVRAISSRRADRDRGGEEEGALVVGQRRGQPGQRRAEADPGVEEGGEGAHRGAAARSRRPGRRRSASATG